MRIQINIDVAEHELDVAADLLNVLRYRPVLRPYSETNIGGAV